MIRVKILNMKVIIDLYFVALLYISD